MGRDKRGGKRAGRCGRAEKGVSGAVDKRRRTWAVALALVIVVVALALTLVVVALALVVVILIVVILIIVALIVVVVVIVLFFVVIVARVILRSSSSSFGVCPGPPRPRRSVFILDLLDLVVWHLSSLVFPVLIHRHPGRSFVAPGPRLPPRSLAYPFPRAPGRHGPRRCVVWFVRGGCESMNMSCEMPNGAHTSGELLLTYVA
jgi:hypothetical protein